MAEVVLDASALLAALNAEPGAEMVLDALPQAAISSVNLSEVITKLAGAGMPPAAIQEALGPLPIEVMPFDEEQAYAAGLLRSSTKHVGLSLGDRGCLSLARRLGLPVLTSDRAWERLGIGVTVRLIR